jgi:hypothetical protein
MDKDRMVFVVLHLGKSGMEVIAERSGVRRRVNVTWHRAEKDDIPPEDWPNQVRQEMDFQDSNPTELF